MAGNPTPTQQKVIDGMNRFPGEPLRRYPGGWWTADTRWTIGRPENTTYFSSRGAYWCPLDTWWCDIRTIRAMEKTGLLERKHVLPEEWRDHRRLVQKDASKPQ